MITTGCGFQHRCLGKWRYVDMWNYEKRLEYPVKIKQTNPALAAMIISQYGGPDFVKVYSFPSYIYCTCYSITDTDNSSVSINLDNIIISMIILICFGKSVKKSSYGIHYLQQITWHPNGCLNVGFSRNFKVYILYPLMLHVLENLSHFSMVHQHIYDQTC